MEGNGKYKKKNGGKIKIATVRNFFFEAARNLQREI
jgi:hypothetical protein